jgi:hypothetical protein
MELAKRFEVLDGLTLEQLELAKEFGEHEGIVQSLLVADHSFSEFLEEELALKRLHYFHACATFTNIQGYNDVQKAEFVKNLMTVNRAEFLSSLTGQVLPNRFCRMLYKIADGSPWPEIWYSKLFKIADTEVGDKALTHAKSIALDGLKLWLSLPQEVRLKNLLRIFVTSPLVAAEFVETRKLFLESFPKETHENLRQSLKTVLSPGRLLEWEYWLPNSALVRSKFPPPPIRGNRQLVPLESAPKLLFEAKDMNNCLRFLIQDVILGRTYFYLYQGNTRAIVSLEREPDGTWEFAEMHGFNNTIVPAGCVQTAKSIAEEQLELRNTRTQLKAAAKSK